MRHLFCIAFLGLSGLLSLYSQNLESEIGFKYVKAEYLMDTERIEDAIKELNEVISKSPSYKNALFLRALAKYRLAAYKGAKTDILQHIELNGVTLQAINLLAKADYALKSYDAALNSLGVAISLGDKDEKIYEMKAQIHFDRGEMLEACQTWQQAIKLGSTNATLNAKKYCGMRQESTKSEPPVVVKEDNDTKGDDSSAKSQDQSDDDTSDYESSTENSDEMNTDSDEDLNEIEDERNELLEDNTVNTLVIDEDLSIEIYGQGLGVREIIDRPSILILAEQDGEVAVEFCVNDRGKVTYVEFYPAKSTLAQKSLVSLAIRKAKEFWFEKSDLEKQCGYMIFKIKAG